MGYLVHLGNVLGGNTHEDVIKGIHHTVVIHTVHELLMTHLKSVREPISR